MTIYTRIMTMKHRLRDNRGFTLLIAALIASIVLSLASAIFDIAQKQITLASDSQNSQYAFYAADTVAECALYWDVRYNYFATTTPSLASQPIPQSPVPPSCNGHSIVLATALNNQSYPYTLTYPQIPQVDLTSGTHPACAQVTVEKCQGTISASGACTSIPGGSVATQIRANGYNTTCAAISTSPTVLERSVELNY